MYALGGEMSKARLEAFSDGVIAVAITLLALDLTVPEPGHVALLTQLSDHWPQFAAYAVSRYRFRGRRVFTLVVLSTQMFPGILFLLPLFLIFVSIGNATGIALIGSRTGLVITYLTFSLPFSIWLLVGYFDSIPRGLDEAAWVDGCGPLRALFRVVIPAAIPGIITVAIYAFMTAWGEVLFASVMTNDTTRTLAVGLRDYSTQNDVYWNQIMAASIVVSIPVVAGFLLMQRFLVTGLTAGSVK